MVRLYFWLLLLGVGFRAHAQQFVCEREFRTMRPMYIAPAGLLRVAADSLRLLSEHSPALTGTSFQARIQRVALRTCDTLTTGPAFLTINRGFTHGESRACANRRGQILLMQSLTRPRAIGSSYDSAVIVVQLLNRNGTPRWQRVLRPSATIEGANCALEAPGNGFFLFGGEAYPQATGTPRTYDTVIRLDSTGRELWRRRYYRFGNAPVTSPVYTQAGTIIAVADSTFLPQGPMPVVIEYNQRGDRLLRQLLVIEPQQLSLPLFDTPNSVVPLRNGSFAFVGYTDSLNLGLRAFLARFDARGNLLWRYRMPATIAISRLDQPRELADGSLLVVASNYNSGRNTPFWLFRFSSTGQLLARYPFSSQVLTPNAPSGLGYFGRPLGLEGLADSTLVVVAGNSGDTYSNVYLAHLRVPGLPRLLDNHVVPAADPLATRSPLVAQFGLRAYPIPASEKITFTYFGQSTSSTGRILLCDAVGRIVATTPVDRKTTAVQLSVSALPAGFYTAVLELDSRVVATQKLTVQH